MKTVSTQSGAAPTRADALPRLSRALLEASGTSGTSGPYGEAAVMMALPEKVVQFGTGAFLRGFIEDYIDAANRRGRFGGRIVMVGSTGSGRDRVIDEQDGLYTLCVRGMEHGAVTDTQRVISSVSRALSATDEWDAVLECARNPALELVFSNTTEVGIALDEDDAADLSPPRSFPGKLTRFLYERALAFGFRADAGVVVIPCELVEQNGERLRDIVLELAGRWSLDRRFALWLHQAVPFCNTLVDRIVAGTPGPAARDELCTRLGYRDELLTVAEPYSLLVIEGDDALRERLGFAAADPDILITDDATPYRERKVRLLNGAHTALVPAALLAGCTTVREAMEHEAIGAFIRGVLLDEIVPTLAVPDAHPFAHSVLDRFANPFLDHSLIDITLHATAKVRVRLVPSIMHYALTTRTPRGLAFAFAAFLLLQRGDLQAERRAAGLPVPPDPGGRAITDRWAALPSYDDATVTRFVSAVCGDRALWHADLRDVPGFAAAVASCVLSGMHDGVHAALQNCLPGMEHSETGTGEG